MTTNTPNLNLVTYNGITDGSALFATFADDISGSMPTQNIGIIDAFAGRVSGSLTGLSASIVDINNSIVDISASIVPIATSAEVTAGASNSVVISASSLAKSDYGKRSVIVPLNTSASLTTADYNFVPIPASMNGWILVDADATCSGLASKSGSIVLQVYNYPFTTTGCATGGTSMLSTDLTIGENQHISTLFPTQPVINTSASSVLSTQRIQVRVSSSGSSATYVQAELTFQNLS